MSEKYEGYVGKIFENTFTYKKGRRKGHTGVAYSVGLETPEGERFDSYFGFGFDKPSFEEGDYIRFEATENARGNLDYVDGSGAIVSEANRPPRAQQEQREQKQVEQGTTSYNSNVQRADRAYHAARGSAIDLIPVLQNLDALPLAGGKTKANQAERYQEVLDLVDKLTVQFFRDEFPEGYTDQFRLLDLVDDAGTVDTSPDAPLPNGQVSEPAEETPGQDGPPPDDDRRI